MMELEKLEALPNLLEVSVIGNAVSRRLLHRPMLVFQQPNLQTIDGITVTPEERDKAELYFMDQQVCIILIFAVVCLNICFLRHGKTYIVYVRTAQRCDVMS